MDAFIKALPKAELHLHIEGTLEPELMFALAERNGLALPFASVEAVRQAYRFNDLQSFLDIYYQGAQVLIHEQDFYDLTWAYLLRCQQQQVQHLELFFDPQTHTDRGIAFSVVINGISQALARGQRELGISSRVIMCFLRHLPEASALQTLAQAQPYRALIAGVGLDSGERGNPPSNFAEVFAQARAQGYRLVAHAGEEGPADYIWQALNLLKVERIDHGVRCVEDPALVAHLEQRAIPLTVCPLSNTALKVYHHMAQHVIRQLFDAGVRVTINSDDPAYFGGHLNENYRAVQRTFNFTRKELAQLAKNSFLASFLAEEDKQQALHAVDQYLDANEAL
jgi:adenine deaminase